MVITAPTIADNKVDLDADNAFQTTLGLDDTRNMLELLAGEAFDDLASELDEAQGLVHSGKADVSYLVIAISK